MSELKEEKTPEELEEEEAQKEVEDDVEDMFSEYVDKPSEEKPLEEKPAEELPKDELPKKESEEKPKEGSEKVDEKPEEVKDEIEKPLVEDEKPIKVKEEDTELEDLKKTNATLRESIEEMSGRVGVLPAEEKPLKEVSEEDKPITTKGVMELLEKMKTPQVAQVAPVVEAKKVKITQDEFDNALVSRDAFEELMNKKVVVAQPAQADPTERIMAILPNIISNVVKTQVVVSTAVENFYNNNKDLRPFKQFVSVTMNEVLSGKPELRDNIEGILIETEKSVRSKLNLRKEAKAIDDKAKGKGPSPAFPNRRGGGGGGRSLGKDDVSEDQKEIDALM